MAHGPPLSADEKARILELRAENAPVREIAQRMGRSVNVVAVFLRNPSAYGKTIRKPRGKQPALDDSLLRQIFAGHARQKSVAQITAGLSVPVSQLTVATVLKNRSLALSQTAAAAGEEAGTTAADTQKCSVHHINAQAPTPTPASALSGNAAQVASSASSAPSSRPHESPSSEQQQRPSERSPHSTTSLLQAAQPTRAPAATRASPANAGAAADSPPSTELMGLLDRKLDTLAKLLADQNAMFSQLVTGQNALMGQLVVVLNTMTQMLQLQQQQQEQRQKAASAEAGDATERLQ